MKKMITIGKVTTRDGGLIHLYERDKNYFISIDGKELMSTRKHASEEALALLTCSALAEKSAAKVLIGGLGFGFTLGAALSVLGKTARVVIAEILPEIVAWNRNPNLKLSSQALADPRVEVIERDVAEILRSSRAQFDAILLDIDNGPTALCAASNSRLYLESGLQMIKRALRPQGTLGIWSAKDQHGFSKRMASVGFAVEVKRVPAYKDSGQLNTLYLGRR